MYNPSEIETVVTVQYRTPDGVVHDTLAEALEHTPSPPEPEYEMWASNKREGVLIRKTSIRPHLSISPMTTPWMILSITAILRAVLSMASMAPVGMPGTRTTGNGFLCRKVLATCLRIFVSKGRATSVAHSLTVLDVIRLNKDLTFSEKFDILSA